MDWKQKAKEFYHKVAHGVMRYVAPVLMMLPSAGAARSNVKADKDEVFLKQKNSEATVTNDVSENAELTHPLIYNPEIYQDINCLDMEKVAEKISQMTLGEILQKGLISQEQLQAYQFSTEDFEQMEQGDLGDKLESFLQKKCKGNPQGDCLTGVRQGAANAWGVNVWTPSGLAKDWPESVAKSNMPVAFLGKVIVKEGKDGKLEDQGNIKLKDLLSLPGAIVVIDGNRQPAGHVSYVKRKKDKTGKRVATISLCDGRENYETVVNKKSVAEKGVMETLLRL